MIKGNVQAHMDGDSVWVTLEIYDDDGLRIRQEFAPSKADDMSRAIAYAVKDADNLSLEGESRGF